MSRQQRSQAGAALATERVRAHDGASRPRQLRRYVSVKQLAIDLDFVTTAPGDPEDACRTWLRRHHILGLRRGRVILVDPLDVDRALRGR